MTPITINKIFLKVRKFGFSTDKHQPARRTATGVVAWHEKVSLVDKISIVEETIVVRHLQHLDKRNTQVLVSFVSTDQTQTEEQSDRENSPEVDLPGHPNCFTPIKKGACPGQNLCRYC